jgi:ABC-2 type transport system ATP-binding protein
VPSLPVETHGLSKRYPTVTALADCGLSVTRGEVFGLLGPNGAGKSTLIRLLLGFLSPTSGEARIEGFDCRSDSLAVRSRVAYLPGDVRLFRTMTGRGVLEFLSRLHPAGNLARAVEVARRLDLDLSRRVTASSSGMRQKVALAATLAIDAPVVILDEPTTHLDPTARREVLALVREARQAGRTVVFSSHVMSEVEEACDRVAILRAGRLVHTQAIEALRRQHRIQARLDGPLGEVPAQVREHAQVTSTGSVLDIVVSGELRELLGWLATLPLADLQIEPLGLKIVYDEYHGNGAE